MGHYTISDQGSYHGGPLIHGINGAVYQQLTIKVHKGLYFIIITTTETVNAKTKGGNGPLPMGMDSVSLQHNTQLIPDSHVTLLGICHSRNPTQNMYRLDTGR